MTAAPDFSRIPWRKLHCAPPDSVRADWAGLGWQARGLYGLLLAASNRDGLIELGRAGLPGCAALLAAPWSEVEGPLRELLNSGWAENDQASCVLRLPYFEPSQDAVSPEAEKKRKQRTKGHTQEGDNKGTVPGQSPDTHGTDGDIPDRIENREVRIENKQDPPKSPKGTDGDLQAKQKADPEDIGRNAWDAIQQAAGGPKALGLDRCYGSDPSCWLEDNRLNAWIQTWRKLRAANPPVTLADCEKLGRWIVCGGAGKVTPWQLLAKPGNHANVGQWFDRANRWDGVSDPSQWPSTRAPAPPPEKSKEPEPERKVDRLMREHRDAIARGEQPADLSPPPGFFEQLRKTTGPRS